VSIHFWLYLSVCVHAVERFIPGGGFLMLRCIYESLCPEKTTKWPSRVKSRHQMLPAGLTQAYERPMISIEFVPHLRGRVCE